MAEEKENQSAAEDEKIKDTAAQAIIKVVDKAYTDFQPAIKPLSEALKTVTSLISASLAPVRFILAHAQAEEQSWYAAPIAEVLEERDIPKERIIPPRSSIAGPALLDWLFADSDELRKMYAALLATAMDKETADTAHPGSATVIRQLTPDEARIIEWLYLNGHQAFCFFIEGGEGGKPLLDDLWLVGENAGCSNLQRVPIYIGNLNRLGITTFIPTPVPDWEVTLSNAEFTKGKRKTGDLDHLTPERLVDNLRTSTKRLEVIKHPYSSDEEFYDELLMLLRKADVLPVIKAELSRRSSGKKPTFVSIKRRRTFLTKFGLEFCQNCVVISKPKGEGAVPA
jgi:Abortive infection alpha